VRASIVVVDSAVEPAGAGEAAAAEAAPFELTKLRNDGDKARINPRAQGLARPPRRGERRVVAAAIPTLHVRPRVTVSGDAEGSRFRSSLDSRIDGASAAAIQRLKPTSRVPIASSRNAHERFNWSRPESHRFHGLPSGGTTRGRHRES